MFGWLVGKANKKNLLVKIFFNNKKKNQDDVLIDEENATYYINEFKIVNIIDEYNNNYISVDIIVVKQFFWTFK